MVLPQPLVDARWLVAHHDEVRLVDCRWYLDGRSGRAAYEADHLPGAVWVDLDLDLSAPATSADGRHPFPTADLFAASLSRLGIGQETPVVVYDDACGSMAARLWWMLRILDHPVAVLDARTRSRYAAGDPTIDPRQGHIPGAKSAPWTDNVSPDGTLLDPASLRTRFVVAVGRRPHAPRRHRPGLTTAQRWVPQWSTNVTSSTGRRGAGANSMPLV